MIRRKYAGGGNKITLDGLVLDLSAKEVYYHEQPVVLNRNEYELLFFLISNKNRVVSRQAIAEHLSGDTSELAITRESGHLEESQFALLQPEHITFHY